MLKDHVHSGKPRLGHPDNSSLQSSIMAGALGLGFLIAEGAVLSLEGVLSIAVPLIAVLLASTVSSIVGFAFSALCGALLFHLVDSPVYAVQWIVDAGLAC